MGWGGSGRRRAAERVRVHADNTGIRTSTQQKKKKEKKRITAKGPHGMSKSRCRILADAVNNLRSDLQRTAPRR